MNEEHGDGLLFRGKLQLRVFVILLLVGFCPLLVIALIGLALSKSTLEQNASEHMEAVAQMRAARIHRRIKAHLVNLEVIAQSPCVLNSLLLAYHLSPKPGKNTCDLMETSRHAETSFVCLGLLDPEKNLVTTAGFWENNLTAEMIDELIQKAKQSDKAVLGGICHRSDLGLVARMSRKVTDATGLTVGYLVGLAHLSPIIDQVMQDTTGLGRTSETYLINEEGIPISQSRFCDRQTVEKPVPRLNPDMLRLCRAGQHNASVYASYHNQKVLGSCKWMQNYQWGMVAETSTNVLFRPINTVRTVVLVAGLMLLVIVMLASAGFAGGITRSIRRLAKAAEAVGRGDLNTNVPVSSSDEVGRLTETFNNMVERLRTSQSDLAGKQQELQEAYDQLVRAQHRLVQQERIAAIGQFTASIIHEMRNPLSSIKMNLQILARHMPTDDRLGRHLQIADETIIRLERMMGDLLNFAKPIEIKPSVTRFQPLVEAVFHEYEETFRRQGIEPTISIAKEAESAFLDLERFRQVLTNLVANAVEAMPSGGRLTVSTSPKDNQIVMTISDTGVGIGPEGQQRLFEPFYTTKESGVGLGLLMVRKIVEAHQGSIEIESRPREGATVRLHWQGKQT